MKHNCPYLKKSTGECSMKPGKYDEKNGKRYCAYRNPSKCPILTNSSCWKTIYRFFRKSSQNRPEALKTLSHMESDR